jgi:hypothetical protein
MRGKSLEIYQHLSLRAVEQAYQEAVQSVSILNDTQQCQKRQSYESFGTFVGI